MPMHFIVRASEQPHASQRVYAAQPHVIGNKTLGLESRNTNADMRRVVDLEA